jgi:hypothetical protein
VSLHEPNPHPNAAALNWWKTLTERERTKLVQENFPGFWTQVITTMPAKIQILYDLNQTP